jgi:hypothetical protein
VTTTRVEVEEIESTKSEKALAVVLTVFLLIGAMWTYAKLDDLGRGSIAQVTPTSQERAAIARSQGLERRQSQVDDSVRQARGDLELAREAYRTALDAGQAAPALRARYEHAQSRYAQLQAQLARVSAAAAAARPAATAAGTRVSARQRDAYDRQAWIAAGLRLGFAAALLVLGYWLLTRLRRRRTRYLPLAFAVIATAAIVALTFACDYLTDYIDPLDLGPLVLSLFGVAATVAAFAVLQRHLARRIPIRRVRKGECPFCGYPVRAGGTRCEGCGREVIGECAACAAARRVGTAHCAACGAV